MLKPLIEEKNQTRSRYLQVGTRSCKRTYRRLQRKVQKAITDAKSKWILKVATEGEEAVKDGKIRWDCIRKLQRVHGGRRPVRPSAVLNDNGQLTEGPEDTRDHCTNILRKYLMSRAFTDENVVADIPILEPMLHFDDPPYNGGTGNCFVPSEGKEARWTIRNPS